MSLQDRLDSFRKFLIFTPMNRIKRKQTTVYHCMTRAVAGEFLLDQAAKNVLREMQGRVAGFCGVEVLAFCIMSNHFHILVRVPERGELSRGEVLRRYRILYEDSPAPDYPSEEVMRAILEGEDEALAQEWMDRLTVRMNDVSEFMRILKHRLTLWYNKKHERYGTLWAERFKSVLIENRSEVLRTVAAYLDLNPVRAGLVEDPADYPWCSYREAMVGNPSAQAGLAAAMGKEQWDAAAPTYRVLLFGTGGVVRRSGQATIPAERVREVLESGGTLEPHELLRCQVRHFSAGAILGSKSFVREVGEALPKAKPKRTKKAEKSASTAQKKRSRAPKALGTLPVSIEGFSLLSWRRLKKQRITPGPASVSALSRP